MRLEVLERSTRRSHESPRPRQVRAINTEQGEPSACTAESRTATERQTGQHHRGPLNGLGEVRNSDGQRGSPSPQKQPAGEAPTERRQLGQKLQKKIQDVTEGMENLETRFNRLEQQQGIQPTSVVVWQPDSTSSNVYNPPSSVPTVNGARGNNGERPGTLGLQ